MLRAHDLKSFLYPDVFGMRIVHEEHVRDEIEFPTGRVKWWKVFLVQGISCVLKVHTAKDIESSLFYNKLGEAGKAERDVRLEY